MIEPVTAPAEEAELPIAESPSPIVVPDRADAPVSEITERFLRAVIAKVPLDHIEELHLFSPLRQSGVETGIAVVAARVPVAAPDVDPLPDLALEFDGDALNADAAAADDVSMQAVQDADLVDVADAVETVDALLVETDDETTISADAPGVVSVDDAEVSAPEEMALDETTEAIAPESDLVVDIETEADAEDVSVHAEAGEDSPYLDEALDGALDGALGDDHAAHASNTAESMSVLPSDAADDEPLDDESPSDGAIPDAVITPIERHTVYTARYRLVQKGPERGKWESDVVAEADAPLITVEMVVRGVQQRAGEESEILRYSAAQIARALRMEWPVATEAPDSAAA